MTDVFIWQLGLALTSQQGQMLHYSHGFKALKRQLNAPAGRVLLTFTEAVSQAGLPCQQGLLTIEAQQGGLGQAENGQSKRHTFAPLSHLQAADLLQRGAQPLLVTLHFV